MTSLLKIERWGPGDGKEGEDSWGDPWIHFPLGGRIWLTPCKASGGGEGGCNGEGVMLERYLHRSILLYTIVLSSGASGEVIYPEFRDLGYLMPRQWDFWHSSCWVNTMKCILICAKMFQSRNDQHDAKMKDGLMWWTLGVAAIHQVWPWTNPEALTTCDNIF